MTCRCRSGECDPECDGVKLRAELDWLRGVSDELLKALKDIVSEIRAYQSPECDDIDAPGAAELKAADIAVARAEASK